MNLEEIKAKYPAYANISDQELADKIYQKHYANKIPVEEYYSKIGYRPQQGRQTLEDAQNPQQILDILGLKEGPKSSLEQIKNMYGGFDVSATKGGLGVSQLIANALANKGIDFGHKWQDTIEKMRLANEEKEAGLAGSNDATLGSAFATAIKSAPALIAGGAVGKGLGVLGLGSAASPALKWGGNALKNILSAGAFGGVNEGMNVIPQGEERLPHVLEGASDVAKYAAAFEALGLGAKGASKVLKGEAKLPSWMTKEQAGKTVGEPAKALKNELVSEYESYINKSESAGAKANTKSLVTERVESGILGPDGKPIVETVTSMKAPSLQQIQSQLTGVENETVDSVHRAYQTGKARDIINAESALGQSSNNIWNDYFDNNKPLDRNALYDIKKMENKLNGFLKEIGEKLGPGEADALFAARQKWATDLRKFLDISPIKKYVEGKLTASDLARKLQGNTQAAELFRATIAKDFKDIGKNKLKNQLLKLGIKSTKIGAILGVLGI